jgi:hypothetical protein
MLRKIIAGTVMAGVLTLGTAGLVGAATPSPSTQSGGGNLAALCAKLPQVQALVTQWQSDLNAFLPKVQAIESQAKVDGFTNVANAIGNGLTRVQNRQSKVSARLSKIEARCNAVGSSNSSSSNGSTTS